MRARAIRRLIKEAKCETQRLLEVSKTPLTENNKHLDLIESHHDLVDSRQAVRSKIVLKKH